MTENEKQTNDNEIIESNAARRMRLRGEDIGEDIKTDDIEVNRLANFWYHNKVWVLIAAFFVVMITIVTVQYAKQSNPDIYLLYGGPEHITANEAKAFSSLLEDMMDDYNGDGKKLVQSVNVTGDGVAVCGDAVFSQMLFNCLGACGVVFVCVLQKILPH